jgi:hypothetical protein
MVVNLVRSGRKQPQLFSASAGGKARHLIFEIGELVEGDDILYWMNLGESFGGCLNGSAAAESTGARRSP